MKTGRPRLSPEKRRITYAVTVLPEHIDFIKKNEIIGSQIWDEGIKIFNRIIIEKNRGEKFEKAWIMIYPKLLSLLPEKISQITNSKGTTVQFEPISKEQYLEHIKIEYRNVYAIYNGLPENPFEKVDLTPKILIERVKEKIKEVTVE